VIWEQEKVKEIKEIKEKLSKSCTDAYSSSISRVQSHLEQEKKSLLEDFERDKQMIKVKYINSIIGFIFKRKRYADEGAFRSEEKTFRGNQGIKTKISCNSKTNEGRFSILKSQYSLKTRKRMEKKKAAL
jgi:hypothetical protein